MSTCKDQRYRLIQVDCDKEIDYYKNVILALWRENLPGLSDDRFKWIYKHNPYGPAKTILAQKVDTQEYVGCATVYPRLLYVDGKELRAGIVVDFAVNKEHRVFGPAVMMQRKIIDAYLSKEFDVIYGYPNSKSIGVIKRVGYSLLGDVEYWTKILDWAPKLMKVFKIRLLAVLGGFFLDIISILIEIFHKIKSHSNCYTKVLTKPTQAFNILWEKAKDNYSVIGEKSLDYLQWRYSTAESKVHKFFCVYNKKDALCAYLVYEKKDDVAIICDLFAEDIGNIRQIMVLFTGLMRKLKYKSIVMMYLGDASYSRIFKEVFFVNKRDKRSMLIFLGNNLTEQEKSALLKSNKWFLLDGELDL